MNPKITLAMITLLIGSTAMAGAEAENLSKDTQSTTCLKEVMAFTKLNLQESVVKENGKEVTKLLQIYQKPAHENSKPQMIIYAEDGGSISIDSSGTGCNRTDAGIGNSSINQTAKTFAVLYNNKKDELNKQLEDTNKMVTKTDADIMSKTVKNQKHRAEVEAFAKKMQSIRKACEGTRYLTAFGIDQFVKAAAGGTTASPPTKANTGK